MTEKQVDHQSDAVAGMAAEWPMLDALIAGTLAMRAAGSTFLPQFPKESRDSYEARLGSSTLFPAFSRTCEVMGAKPFARAIKMEGVPEAWAEWFSDIDLAETDIHAFCAQLMLDCLQKGMTGVLVEYPRAMGVKTRAQELASGARPYLTRYPSASILGWRTEGNTLTQLRLLECVEEEDGEFATVVVKQIRVLTPGAWTVYRKEETVNSSASHWIVYESGGTTLDKIPFVFFYGTKKGFGVGVSPLIDLAYLNVEHWQSASDQQNILHVARVPVLFAKGFSSGDVLVIGGAQAATSSNDNADLKYVEHSGAAIEAGRNSLIDLEDRMRQTGAELLVQRPMTTTATQVQSEGDGSRSALQMISEKFEDSFENCLVLMGEWINQTIEPEVELYKDFGASNLSDAAAAVIVSAVAAGIASKETAFTQLQRMDIIPQGVSFEEDTAKVDVDQQKGIEREGAKAKLLADAAGGNQKRGAA